MKCEKTLTTLIPFKSCGFVGLKSVPHECGDQYQLKVMIQANLKDREEWRKFVQNELTPALAGK